MGYTKDMLKGVSWVGGFRFSSRLISFARIAVLARLLTPLQFGVFGIATLVLAFVEIFTETGINIFLIQKQEAIDKYINTAWIVSILRGIFIAVVIIATAPIITSFFHSPESLPLLLLIAAVPFLRGFINPAIVKLQKDLKFHREFWVKLPIFLAETLVTVVLAFLTQSAASLVWGLITGAILEVVVSFLVVKPTPVFHFELARAKEVIHRGKWVTAYGIFNYAFEHGDDTVVGKLWGASVLGLYQMAYRISTLPITEVAEVIGRVAFPVYTRISNEQKRLKIAFFKTTLGVIVFSLPIGLIFLIFPKQTIQIILGPQWTDASSALQILALFGVIRAIVGSIFILFLAVGRQEIVTLITLISTVVLLALVVPLTSTFGIVGAGLSAVVGQIVVLPMVAYFAWKILKGDK